MQTSTKTVATDGTLSNESMASIGWLHLTDIHYGELAHEQAWPRLREMLFADLERLHNLCGPWDIVFIAGNVTRHSSPKEFEALDLSLAQIWDHLGALGSNPSLLAVPGECDRIPLDTDRADALILSHPNEFRDALSGFWFDDASAYRDLVNHSFRNYSSWIERSKFCALVRKQGILPGDFSSRIRLRDKTIGIVGLNTAFIQMTPTTTRESLTLNSAQLNSVCSGDGPAWLGKNDANILLTHHSAQTLPADARTHFFKEIASPGRFVAHLFGSTSGATATVPNIGDISLARQVPGISLVAPSGLINESRLKRTGYLAGRMTLDERGEISMRVWPRVAKPHHVGHERLVPDYDHFELCEDQGTLPETVRRAEMPAALRESQSALDTARLPPSPGSRSSIKARTLESERNQPYPYIELFERLRSLGVEEGTLDDLYGWPNNKLCSLVENCLESMNSTPNIPYSMFTFAANSQLSGGPSPCVGESCRLESANQMARFAALYAEHVVIQNPFDRHVAHGIPNFDNDTRLYSRRYGLVGDLRVLFSLRPLIESGLISFTSPVQHFCPVCVYESDRRGNLAEFVGESEAKGWQKRVSQMVACLRREFRQGVTAEVRLKPDGKGFEVELSGDDGLIEHGILIMSNFQPPEELARRARRQPVVLTPREFWRSRVLHHPIAQIIEDLAVQNYFANMVGSNYLTSRGVDLKLISSICAPEIRAINQSMLTGLGHPVPYVDDVPLSNLLHLRKTDGEAFQVYRDAISSVARSVGQTEQAMYQEAIADIVRPELEKIDALIEKARSRAWRSLTTSMSIGIGLVSIGMFTGLIPPQLGAALTALGALGGLTTGAQVARKDTAAETNRFYFLWKVKQAARFR